MRFIFILINYLLRDKLSIKISKLEINRLNCSRLFLCVHHFNAVASRKQFELFKRDGLFSSEVPLDQVLEFSLLEPESTPLYQVFELVHCDGVSLRVLDPIEESFEEHVVLLFVGEFH